MNILKTLPVNETGRDFVIGDLHGSLDLMTNFMKSVHFNPDTDRMISVGDLVDRGPKSWACFELLQEPWFHAVKGNHEQLMEDYLTKGPTGPWWFQNGGDWWAREGHWTKEPVEVSDVVDALRNVPLVMTVPMKDGRKFHLIHAELMSEVPLTDEDFAIDGMLDNPATEMSSDGETVIWGRGFFMRAYGAQIDVHEAKKWGKQLAMDRFFRLFNKDLSVIFSGHSVMQRPTRIGGNFAGQINLDTGAYMNATGKTLPWAGLSVCEPFTNKFWLSRTDGVKEVECLHI